MATDQISTTSLSDPWPDYNQMIQTIGNRKVIFWGCFTYFEKTIAAHDFNVAFLVDSSKNQQGKAAHHGFDVLDPGVLKDLQNREEYYIIISTTAFYQVIDQMIGYGYKIGSDFCVTPVLKNQRVIYDILHYDQQLIFSSSDGPQNKEDRGGGIYTYDCRSGEIEKRFSGVTRGFTTYKGHHYVVDALTGVQILDSDFKTVDIKELPKQSYPHGIVFDEKRNLCFVVLARHDRIGVFDSTSFKLLDEIKLSSKFDRTGNYYHHMNDICLQDDSLYISMFSITGNVRVGCHDGAVVEYDLEEKRVVGSIARDLWQPHSVKIIDGKLAYLDSMRGNLHVASHKVETHFNGFIRGLAFDGRYYFIGQSVHRYFDRMQGASNNISVDSGIFMFDPQTKACRLLPTPKVCDINTLEIFQKEL